VIDLHLFGYRKFRHWMLQQARTLAASDRYRALGYRFWLAAAVAWLAKPPLAHPTTAHTEAAARRGR
jgi:hypothetical protein